MAACWCVVEGGVGRGRVPRMHPRFMFGVWRARWVALLGDGMAAQERGECSKTGEGWESRGFGSVNGCRSGEILQCFMELNLPAACDLAESSSARLSLVRQSRLEYHHMCNFINADQQHHILN